MIETQELVDSPRGLIYIRYDAVLKHLPIASSRDAVSLPYHLLDVGGSCLSKKVISDLRPGTRVLTLNIRDEYHGDPKRQGEVVYDGDTIPLPSNSVPFVIAVDTLEHMPNEKRQRFVNELFRVASEKVIISCPFHHRGNIKGEKSLIRKMVANGVMPKPSLVEHQKYGLPKKSELIAIAREINPRRFALYSETKRNVNLRLLRVQIGMDKSNQPFWLENFNYTMRHYPAVSWNEAYRAVLELEK